MKIQHVYNCASHYRESIFRLIDSTFDCDYIFGKEMGDIKQMDTSVLKGNVTLVENRQLPGRLYWQPEVQGRLRKDYDAYILLGEARYLSTWLFCLRARLFYPKKRIYFWAHGLCGNESRIQKAVKKLFLRLPNAGIFLYGNYARNHMIKEGFDPEKLYVIHNSLAYDRQLGIRQGLAPDGVYREHFGNDDPNLIFIGRLTRVKQLDLILRAMKLLADEGRRYNLTLIGGGEQQDELQALTRELGLTENVWFYGPCYDEAQLGHMLYNADLCVSPGNVGLTAMHSMVFGMPVLTHNDFAWQMPEFEAIKEGETGGFFERDNVESLKDAIVAWFGASGYDRERLRRNCFEEIDRYWTPQFEIDVLKAHLPG